MTAQGNQDDRLQAMEARIDALSALLKSTLTTLVIQGVLTKAHIPTLVREGEAALAAGGHPAAQAQLRSIQEDLPSYLRAAMGPAPDDDHDDH